MGKFIDIRGQRFSRLIAIEPSGHNKRKKVIWRCLCDCGQEIKVESYLLRNGNTRSCGCLQRDIAAEIGKQNATHGKTHTKAWSVWRHMIERCSYEKHKSWDDYGGRGITVCDRWLKSFEAFYQDMGEPPNQEYCLDRIDSNGSYSPDNCRWTTRKEQQRNRRNNVFLTLNNETKTLVEWAENYGVDAKIVRERLKNNWSIAAALTTPVRKIKRSNS